MDSAKLMTMSAPGTSDGSKTTTKGADTTDIPKPIEDCTNAPASTASPRASTVAQSIRGTR